MVDVGKINERYFINISSLGFDAEVVYKSHKIKSSIGNRTICLHFKRFATLISYKTNPLKIIIDGQTIEKALFLVAVANGKYYGGGMQAVPLAEIMTTN